MKYRRQSTLLLLILALAAVRPVFAEDETVAPPTEDETLIYVVREGRFAGSMNKMWIAVNDRTVARIENDAYTVVRVPAGRVTLNLATAGMVAGSVAVDDRPGETVYLSWRLGDFFLTELDPEEAHATLANLPRTPPIDDVKANNEQVQANFALDMLGLDLTQPATETITPDDEHAVITIFRRDKKELVRVALWSLDGYVGLLELNQGIQIKVPAGEQTIFAGLIPDTTLLVDAEAGKNYYAFVDIGMVNVKIVPVESKNQKKLSKWLEKVSFVARNPDKVTNRVREREDIVVEFLRSNAESGQLVTKKSARMDSKHAFEAM